MEGPKISINSISFLRAEDDPSSLYVWGCGHGCVDEANMLSFLQPLLSEDTNFFNRKIVVFGLPMIDLLCRLLSNLRSSFLRHLFFSGRHWWQPKIQNQWQIKIMRYDILLHYLCCYKLPNIYYDKSIHHLEFIVWRALHYLGLWLSSMILDNNNDAAYCFIFFLHINQIDFFFGQYYHLMELKAQQPLLCLHEPENGVDPLNFPVIMDLPQNSSFFSGDNFKLVDEVFVLIAYIFACFSILFYLYILSGFLHADGFIHLRICDLLHKLKNTLMSFKFLKFAFKLQFIASIAYFARMTYLSIANWFLIFDLLFISC